MGGGAVAAGEQASAATSMKIVTSSQRALRTFIRVSLPLPAGAQDSAEEQRAENARSTTSKLIRRIPPPPDPRPARSEEPDLSDSTGVSEIDACSVSFCSRQDPDVLGSRQQWKAVYELADPVARSDQANGVVVDGLRGGHIGQVLGVDASLLSLCGHVSDEGVVCSCGLGSDG